MMSTSTRKVIKTVPKQQPSQGYLLPIEGVLAKIRNVAKDENVTTLQICQIIAQNPMLQYDIIYVANTLRASQTKIANIYHAVLFLGLEKVDSIIAARVALIQ
ncbi:MAG: HDOD domain-containing protein [Gammaproteobacteria bacterium]|nr:HDOD domain-containing protein [Gammaproteobacteria bacterium]